MIKSHGSSHVCVLFNMIFPEYITFWLNGSWISDSDSSTRESESTSSDSSSSCHSAVEKESRKTEKKSGIIAVGKVRP